MEFRGPKAPINILDGPVFGGWVTYAPDEKPLAVIAVLHGRRNPRVMAAILRSRG